MLCEMLCRMTEKRDDRNERGRGSRPHLCRRKSVIQWLLRWQRELDKFKERFDEKWLLPDGTKAFTSLSETVPSNEQNSIMFLQHTTHTSYSISLSTLTHKSDLLVDTAVVDTLNNCIFCRFLEDYHEHKIQSVQIQMQQCNTKDSEDAALIQIQPLCFISLYLSAHPSLGFMLA